MTLLQAKRAQRGFSLVEILIVTSVSLAVAGVAVPKIVTTMANVELRSAIHSAAGVMQQTRMQAIKDNKYRKTRYINTTGGGFVFEDLNDNSAPDRIEPQAQMGNTVMAYSAPTGINSLSSTELNYSPVTVTSITFSPSGQPCNTITSCAVGMVFYFTDTRTVGTPGWAAVSVSPAGRVQCWVWNGRAWTEQY